MAKRLSLKKLLLLSDNSELAKAIEIILGEQADILSFVVEPRGPSNKFVAPHHFDLILLAMSEYASEPVVALARASLGHLLNQVPILIVSYKYFQPHIDAKIAFLDFPFTAEQLETRVDEMLHGNISNAAIVRRSQAKRARSTVLAEGTIDFEK